MTLTEDGLGSFGALSRALGITTPAGFNGAWFGDPLAGGANPHGLGTVLSDDGQRTALGDFVDEVLGPPDAETLGETRWIPLFHNDDPDIGVFAVLEPTGSSDVGTVRVGVGVEHRTGTVAPCVATRLHVPIAHVRRGTAPDPRPTGGDLPRWLVLGRPGGRVSVSVEATLTDVPPVPGTAYLRGATVSLDIPTAPADDVGFTLLLQDLQLPGATAPSSPTLTLDALDEVGSDLLEFLVGLVRAQIAALDANDATFRHVVGLAGALGLREVDHLPPLPLTDLPTRGVAALVDWMRGILLDPEAEDAWLTQLELLTGGHADLARDAITTHLGPATVLVGLQVTSGNGGAPVLVPWVEVELSPATGAKASAHVDLLRVDTGSGQVASVPGLRVEAVLGAEAGGAKLLTGSPGIGSVHVGVALDEQRRPTFVLHLTDVDLPNLADPPHPHHHDLIDLSTPDAAVDVVDDVLDQALTDALGALGDAGDLLGTLLGISPPAGVTGVSVVDVVRDPLAALRRYWHDLTGNSTAVRSALGDLRHLLTGAQDAVTGDGSEDRPWRVALGPDDSPVALLAWKDGDDLVLAVGIGATLDVLDDLTAFVDGRLTVLRVPVPSGPALTSPSFVGSGSLVAGVRPRTGDTVDLSLDVGVGSAVVEVGELAVAARFDAATGLHVTPRGDGLALRVATRDGPARLALPLPELAADGTWTFAPDWAELEQVLANLLRRTGSSVFDAFVDLVGWDATGARLSLADLVADPAAALTAWALDLVLDCRRLGDALGPVAWLLSGGTRSTPLGQGRPESPWRAPVAGAAAAPGFTMWTVPGCPPSSGGSSAATPRDGVLTPESVVSVLTAAAADLPPLADLLHARPGLAGGLGALVVRWTGSDGLVVPPPTTEQDGGLVLAGDAAVAVYVRDGFGYEELSASARTAGAAWPLATDGTATIVHVGCEPGWLAGVPDAERVDATGDPADVARVPATTTGRFVVQVPTVAAAASGRADRDGVAGQVARIVAALGDRTGGLVLVGHGAAGAAAVRATADAQVGALVSDVVTVGTPWSAVSAIALQTGLGGDALRLLADLVPDPVPELADGLVALGGSAARRGIGLVRRSGGPTVVDDLPSAAGLARGAAVRVHAVFGRLTADDAGRALTGLVGAGLEQRQQAALAAPSGIPQEVHVGLDLPVGDLDLGGVLVGAGATFEVLRVDRTAPHVHLRRDLTVRLRLAVADSWLVGGPGAAQQDLEARWVEVRVHLPLDGGDGSTEIVLHDAHAFGVRRETWTVTADAGGVLPEVRVLLGEVVARLAATPRVADLLSALGLLRDAGLDPAALDRLVHDPVTTVRGLVASAPAQLAAAVRSLVGGVAPSDLAPTAVRLSAGGATVTADLATGTVSATLGVTEGPLAVGGTVTATRTGASLDLTVGAVDPDVGGVALVAHAASGQNGGLTLRLDTRLPGRPVVAVPLLPNADGDAVVRLLTTLVPAVAGQVLVDHLRSRVEGELFDAALDAVGLLTAADPAGVRSTVLPWGLVTDPVGWLAARADPLAGTVALLDAVAALVVPDRGATPGWPLTDDVSVAYAVVGGRLELAAVVHVTATVDGKPVVGDLSAGLSIGRSGAPAAVVDAALTVDGWGVDLGVGGAGPPPVHLDLLRPGSTPLRLFPAGAGLGSTVVDAATSLVPAALNALIDHRTDAPSTTTTVAGLVHDVCGALGLLGSDHHVTAARLATYTSAVDPGARLLAQLPALASTGLALLADALDPGHTLISSVAVDDHTRRFDVGPAAVRTNAAVHVTVDGGARPALVLACDVALGSVGRFAVEQLRIDADGIVVGVRGGPFELALGPVVLRPELALTVGTTSGTITRQVAAGLALDPAGTSAVQVRWAIDGSDPTVWAIDPGDERTDPLDVAVKLVGIAVSVATGLVADQLGTVVTDRATEALQGVLLTNGDLTVDPGFVADFTTPEKLLDRLWRLGWNVANLTPGVSVTFGDVLTLALVSEAAGGAARRLGVRLDLAAGRTLVLFPGDPKVELVSHPDWITGNPPGGLSIFLLEGTQDALELVPGIEVAGLGLRFSGAAQPLIQLDALSIDAIEVNVFAEATTSGVGGGARLKLDGLAIAPAAKGGSNAVANNLLKDSGSSGQAARPSFSPSLALQKHAADPDVGVTLRAGDPPGPWWLVIQRQVGPLYVDRVGLDTAESGGSVTRISLLFTGSVSLFGLTAAVDELSISWLGGDLARADQWAVDLKGLAVSADIAGAVLVGGLLKIESDGAISYVGMLVGRFAAYGLSVFGGYTNDHGHASFFVFGGVNGPIGGPPAFFVTGLGGGLGINRGLVVPTDLSRFGEFPFIQALDPSAQPPERPLDRLRELSEIFPHQMGQFWFAAGVSFTCFSLVDGVAVIAVSFGDGLDVNLFGFARMALPRPGAAIVSIELALLAHFSTREGVFLIQAQLTDNSWLLYEDVRLTGGFAFALWWKGPLAGQFVVTMGGYHPDFRVPQGYPLVPRLGLVWQVSDAIVIKGGSYFALTSEALMAGLDIEVSLDFGWVWAKIAFGAHGIVYFDPFWFEVMAYARISAGLHIDLGWFGEISISITIGAQIKVWGPEFAGHAEFEIGPCTIPVDFGSRDPVQAITLLWDAFVTKYLEDAGGAARAFSAITGRGTLPTATDKKEGAPTADGTEALPFCVFAEFEVLVTTSVPATHVVAGGAPVAVPLTLSSGNGTTLGLAPMGAAGLTSTVRITLQHKVNGAWQDDAAHLAKLATGLGSGDPQRARIDTDHFPLGVWGQPKTLGSAAPALPSTDVVQAGARVTLVAGIDLVTTGPQIDYHKVEAGRRPLPLSATSATRTSMLKTARDLDLPTPTTAEQALDLAAGVLFDRAIARPPSRTPSRLAAAAYRGDRVAPPLLGSLTDGLAKQNGADGARTTLDPVARVAPALRRPYVVGLLTSGVGAEEPVAHTTVQDGTLKRRPAPTVASVQGRLGLHVPLALTRTAPPATVKEGTVLASGLLPRTDVSGATAAFTAARVGGSLSALVGGLGTLAGRSAPAPRRSGRAARAAATGQRLRSGDLVLLHAPDSAADADPDRRPSLVVDGTARVVTATGRVVHDDVVLRDGALPLPPGTSVVAVHADGTAPAHGAAGWAAGSRLARLGSQLALAPGAVVSVDSARPGMVEQGWARAADVVRDASEVLTRFSGAVDVVAVVLAGTAPRTLDDASLSLVGAEVVPTAAGSSSTDPLSVVLGPLSVVVQAVRRTGDGPVVVRARRGGAWDVVGVLATTGTAGDLAERLARDGVDGTVAQLLATTGDGAAVSFTDPPDAPPRRAPRAARARATKATATAKKAAAKRATTAKKVTTKKAAATKKSTATKKAAATKRSTATKKSTAKRTTRRSTR